MNHKQLIERNRYLQQLWRDFMSDNLIKPHDLADYITASWKRSHGLGIQPKTKGSELQFMTQLFSNDELQRLFLRMMDEVSLQKIMSYIEELNCIISVYNHEGLYVACLYMQDNNTKDKKHVVENMSEAAVGTNAVACCIKENRACSVIGEEHYISRLKSTAGYAVPYTDQEEKLAGVVYVATDIENYDESMMCVAQQMAKAFAQNSFLHDVIYFSQSYIKILEGITEQSHKGLFFIDQFQLVHGYNQRALDMLDVDMNSSNFKMEILEKLRNMNAYRSVDFNEEIVYFETGKRKKPFLASNQKILLLGQPEGTLISLMDIEDISKWHNKIKGNRAIYTFKDIIGQTKVMTQLKDMARRVAGSSSNVMIHGESGTGKELLAQAIHNSSARKTHPFIAINCGAMPAELIESELFGYEAGTFTGASKSGKIGKMEFASGGTLFLDEIESMPLSVQIKLLRVLSTNRITRLGGVDEIPVDLRIIAATKKDLLEESKAGKFRADLYYRIQIIELKIPPLRDRSEDINLIVEHLIKDYSQRLGIPTVDWSDTFIQAMKSYDWPGNVRELGNVVERALILKENEEILTLEHLTDDIVSQYMFDKVIKQERQIPEKSKGEEGLYDRFERLLLEKILMEEEGNITSAAKRLGLSRQTLYRKLKWDKS